MNNVLVEYLRDENNEPHGCLVGRLIGDTVVIGVSVCHNGMDQFSKTRGREIAEGRIKAGRSSAWRKEDLKVALSGPLNTFRSRCERYFKSDKVEVV